MLQQFVTDNQQLDGQSRIESNITAGDLIDLTNNRLQAGYFSRKNFAIFSDFLQHADLGFELAGLLEWLDELVGVRKRPVSNRDRFGLFGGNGKAPIFS